MKRFLHAVAIWVGILLVAGVLMYEPRETDSRSPGPEEGSGSSSESMDSQEDGPWALEGWEPQSVSSATQLRGRLMVVAHGLSGGKDSVEAKELEFGDDPLDRLASAVVLARFGMKAEAAGQIELASQRFEQGDEAAQSRDASVAGSLSDPAGDMALLEATSAVVNSWPAPDRASFEATPPTQEQFDLLKQRLGWFGSFAQAHITNDKKLLDEMGSSDMKFLGVMFVAVAWFLGAGACGVVALITVIVMGISGKIGSAISKRPDTSLILGETFLAWFILFLGLQFAALMVPLEPGSPARMALMSSLMFVGLSALMWASWRGLSWESILEVTGLRWSQGVVQLMWKACVSYVVALPLMGLGLLIGMGLGWILEVPNLGNPSHPIQGIIHNADPVSMLLIFALACVAAPITEEIIFRGVLYGHLRQGTRGWGVVPSMILSMVVSGAIFAAIHPQGMFVAPALAGLACGFCVTREWTGSVFPGIIAHGIQNATVLALNVLLFQS